MSFVGLDSAQQHTIFAHQVESRHWNALDQRYLINQQNALPLERSRRIIGSRRYDISANSKALSLNNWKQEIPAFSKPGKKTGSWMKQSTKLGESLSSLAFGGSH